MKGDSITPSLPARRSGRSASQQDGSFAADPRWELDVPAQAGPLPVSDIAFSQRGAMILAQRALIAGAYDYSAFTRPGEPQVLRFWLKGPNDPPSPGRWKADAGRICRRLCRQPPQHQRRRRARLRLWPGRQRSAPRACEFSLWTTAQNIRNAPALRRPARSRRAAGRAWHSRHARRARCATSTSRRGPAIRSTMTTSSTIRARAGHLGSVRIYTKPCAAPAVYQRARDIRRTRLTSVDPPVAITGASDTSCSAGDCVSAELPPPPIDLGIRKLGENNPNNPYGPYNFTIGVRNLGSAMTGPQTITVTDVVPAGMTFTNVTSTNWTCTPIPALDPVRRHADLHLHRHVPGRDQPVARHHRHRRHRRQRTV